ncbi:Variant-specific surface protein [Giardia duodenalis]|uniref:Variant-specific surface protein n=1 Tax=Giardia intestinalis TaxID=5741 RepID=V6TTJ0_GIAIN|nr:Variant-specific surface protein [Giardia intestinalis]
MSGKLLLIGVILQLAWAVQVAGGDCESGKFPVANPDNGGNTCVPCNDSNKGGIDYCAECSLLTAKARSSTVLIKCTKCTVNNLSPLEDDCLTDCPSGTYAENGICKPCHESCASCNNDPGAAFCTACYPGYVLSRAGGPLGTCIPECTEEFGANCKTCTAVLGGSRYCSRCETGFVPVDGICVSVASLGRETAVCTSNNDGTCASCTDPYFLQSGGCYQSIMYPGDILCTETQQGKCTICSNSLNPDNGVCPPCPEGCSACTNGNTQQCTKCLAGYYLDSTASKCVKCSKDSIDSTIKGVPNCVSCAPPTGNSGTVLCYVTQEPTVDPADPSVNKGAFSTGVIAGISVVVVLVVGALIGFLCWWFLCKTRRAGVSSSTTTLIHSKSA